MNLIGYCAEKGQHMLIYVYMSKGSLASHLYSKLAMNFTLLALMEYFRLHTQVVFVLIVTIVT